MRVRIIPPDEPLPPATHVLVIAYSDLNTTTTETTVTDTSSKWDNSYTCSAAATYYITKCPEPPKPILSRTEEVRRGIVEFDAWLEQRVRVILAKCGGQRSCYVRPVHQPCWRAGRWKSLT